MINISFVVQGPVMLNENHQTQSYSTASVLKSIRKHFQHAEIILSTWKGTDVSGLDYDKLVLSDDPGSIIVKHIPNPYNHNRLILSSRQGIAEASNDIIVKTRTDLHFESNALLSLLTDIKPIKSASALFGHYILSTTYYVRNPFRLNLLFHASDIILIGKKNDLALFFSAPLVNQENMIGPNKEIKMVAEQYLTLNSIRQVKGKSYSFLNGATNVSQFIDSEKYLFNNFNFYSLEAFGVEFPSRLRFAFYPDGNYTLEETEALISAYRNKVTAAFFSYKRAVKYLKLRTTMYLKAKLQIARVKLTKPLKHANN